MTADIVIKLDDAAVQAAFDRLLRFGQNTGPMMADMAEHLLESTQRRFDTATAPDGAPWVPLRDGSGRKPLYVTGTLRDQIIPSHGRDWAEIAATTSYARFHQEGTGPYVILPRKGRALSFTSATGEKIARRKVNHPGIPARPFMGLSAQDRHDLIAIAQGWIERTLEG